jgi:hypothetical protein
VGDLGVRDERRGPAAIELVPSPAPKWRGHGGPSRTSARPKRSATDDELAWRPRRCGSDFVLHAPRVNDSEECRVVTSVGAAGALAA